MDGFKLFLRFSEGCRCYLENKGLITKEDNTALKSGNPPEEIVKKVFYVAYPGLVKVAKRLGKTDKFDPKVVREYYSFDHNKLKFSQGNLACLAYPARVLEKKAGRCLLNLDPIKGKFRVKSDLNLNKGNWVVVHRLIVTEKIPEDFAKRVIDYLKGLGLSKRERFPKKAIDYLKGLLDASKPAGGFE